ncbi:MAG: nucleotidyltransferase domain-containing protein, partial [Candidatus Omnitrophota bacterium]
MIKNAKIREIILEIVEKISSGYNPEKIILFGSYAKGNSGRNSDIDLLVVKNSSRRRDERDKEIRKLLW